MQKAMQGEAEKVYSNEKEISHDTDSVESQYSQIVYTVDFGNYKGQTGFCLRLYP